MRPRVQVVLKYQPIASVYFDPFSFKLFVYFVLFSSRTFNTQSVQNTFKSSFYTNRFDKLACFMLFRQVSNDNFLKDPLTSTISYCVLL